MRLIDADALMKKYGEPCHSFADVIEDMPTIEAEPVRHGRWIYDINNLYGCSRCFGREVISPKKPKAYCPNCGAKMDLEEK